MKSFKSTAWVLPQPVLIIGTYDKNGKPKKKDVARMMAAAEKRFFHNDNALKDVHAAVRAEKQPEKNNP